MFDRVRPMDADGAVTIVGYALPDKPRRVVERSTCQHCGARVEELRRGRCWGCYQAWAGLRPVGRGARCVVCQERRGDALRLVEIHGRSLPMCHGCATRATGLSPVPYTIDGLRRGLARERRWQDRRIGGLDVRVFTRERRREDRRLTLAGPGPDAADELGEVTFELDLDDIDIVEVTSVQLTSADGKAARSG